MKKIIKTSMALLGLFILASCSGGNEDPTTKTYTTPDEVGAGVYELYYAFIKDAAKEIDAGAKNCDKINDLGIKYKSKIVELGKKREAFSDAEKVICDQSAKDKANAIYVTNTEEYKKFGAFMDQMNTVDYACFSSLFDLISLNLYGNLENVKQSFPDDVKLYEQ